MDINIIKGETTHVLDCKIAVQKSELGRIYFPGDDKAIQALNEGISKGEVFVAINEKNECVGFVWIILNGAFHSFPYIHIIAVKEEFRNLGIGKILLKFCEETFAKENSKLFLVVGDFNPKAKRWYKSMGYKEVGAIPGLYKKGVDERLMMKEL
jgi:ribosomal protein S18 acetylase RimI-like enzyme